MLDSKDVVAHFSNTFFVKSETFIRHYISNMKTFRPICLSWQLENLETYSFPSEDLYSLQLPKKSAAWFYYGIMKRLLHRNLYFETILKRRGARLIHAHFGHNGVQALPTALKLNIPLITTFYGADLSKKEMIGPLKEQYRELFICGDMFLVEGLHMKETLNSLGCQEEKIHIQRIAIPIERIQFKPRKPKGNKTVKLVFCGRFTEKKGLIYALKAIKKVKEEERRDLFITIIGDGELGEQIKEFIRLNNMDSYVELPGFLNYDDYLKRMNEADIFIHPSVTAADGDSEGGAPTTILEAQAMGFPVIATYHADIPNVVVPGESALLSPERDVDALSKNILFLLDNQQQWEKMGNAGREFVENNHDIKKEVLLLEEKYMKLISGSR